MKLCIIIPAFNEEATIAQIVDQVNQVRFPREITSHVVVVVDDGSNDQTAEIARSRGAEVHSHGRNRGVGKAFQSGLDKALFLGADVVVNIDADGQFNPQDIPRLISPVLEGQADFVTASRFKDPALVPEMPLIKRWGNRQMSRLISAIVGETFYDVSCGFRAYSRDTALRLNLWGQFTYTQESFLDFSVKGGRILEVPCVVRGVRQHGSSRVADNLWKYGRRTSGIIFHAFRDYWPMRFFSLLGSLFAFPGLALLGFLFMHYLIAGKFSPHIWSGFVGGGLLLLALGCLITGLLGSILKRIRLNQEEIIYRMKKAEFARAMRSEFEDFSTVDGDFAAGQVPDGSSADDRPRSAEDGNKPPVHHVWYSR